MTEEERTELAIKGAATGVVVVWVIARHIKRVRAARIRRQKMDEWETTCLKLIKETRDRAIKDMTDPQTGLAAGLRTWMDNARFTDIIINNPPL